ncbi:MAG: hypothetical protein ACKO0M_15260 [Cyanobium sp.]
MTLRTLNRLALLVSLLGTATVPAGLAGQEPPRRPGTAAYRGWIQAQRTLTERSYLRSMDRLDALERCLGRIRGDRSRTPCLRLDQWTLRQQQQEERRAWDRMQQQFGLSGPWLGQSGD